MTIERGITLSNWMEPPFNRRAFQQVRELTPTALVHRGDGEANVLQHDGRPLDHVSFESVDGTTTTWAQHLASSYCDAVCVVHDGRIVDERYFNGMHPSRLHLLMSVSKSFCGAALGIAIGRGQLAADDQVVDIAPEFIGTSLDGATVRHVIDMTAGTDFVEDYDAYLAANDPSQSVPLIEYERHAGYRPLGDRTPVGTLGHFRTYGSAFAHGSRFQYRSPLTNIAARLLEVVNDLAYPEIVERDLWVPLGQEHDADIMLDPLGHPVVEGGMSCSLRDLARFGVAYLNDGAGIVPADWVTDTHVGDETAIANFVAAAEPDVRDWCMYRNAFWVIGRGQQYTASGIFGQYCWIDRPTRTVIARFSTYPSALPLDLAAATFRGFDAIAHELASPD